MKKGDYISEEQLNAFVDGELESEEKSSLFSAAEVSPELDQRLCQQHKLKELIQLAYRDVPEPRRLSKRPRGPGSKLGLSMAAAFLLMIGISSGMFIRDFMNQGGTRALSAAHSSTLPVAAHANFLLHVVSGEPDQMRLALENLLHLCLNGGHARRPTDKYDLIDFRG